MRRFVNSFAREQVAAITVEFVVIMSFFVTITFFVLEIALAQFLWQTAEKTVQIGARLAVVSDPAVTAISSTTTNPLATGGAFGQPCPANCDVSSLTGCSSSTSCTWSCTYTGGTAGAGCKATAINYIVTRMGQMYLPLRNPTSKITVTYTYTGLGYAGGPLTPTVTVTLSNVPLNLGVISIVGNLMGTGAAPLFQIPTMSATFPGEDMQSSSSS